LLPKEKAKTKKKNPLKLMDLPQRSLRAKRADAVKGGEDLQAYREQLRNLLINNSNFGSLPGHDPDSLTGEKPKPS
jgi:hypothetical protein